MTGSSQSDSPQATQAHAAAFARRVGPGTVIRLSGDLGTGKTEWVKGFARELGFGGTVTSPTFNLLHEYRGGRLPIFHWDLYRLNPKTDWLALDLPDHLPGSGATIIEWPDRYPGPWPSGSWLIQLLPIDADHRMLVVTQDD